MGITVRNGAFTLFCLTTLSVVSHIECDLGLKGSSYSHEVPPGSSFSSNREDSHDATKLTTTADAPGNIKVENSHGQNQSEHPFHAHRVTSGSYHHPIRHHRNQKSGRFRKSSSTNTKRNTPTTDKDNENKICFVDISKPCVSDAELATMIEEFVAEVFDCHETTTAMTLAVVKDGRTILTKGYGHTKVKQGQPVTSRTRFAIGSVTKAFTAAIIVQWLFRNNKTVDTPIQNFYPEFRVTDDLRSRMATFRDLLAHRMGIPGHIKPLLAGSPEGQTRAQFVRTMADMPTWLSFRDEFTYNNYMYAAAAHVIEKMSHDKTWEEMVREQLLTPLNMTKSGFFVDHDRNFNNDPSDSNSNGKDTGMNAMPDSFPTSNFAHGCAEFNETLEDVASKLWVSIVPCGPAGSIYSNAEDMAKWMNFQLSKGQSPSGDTIVDSEVLAETWNPSILMRDIAVKSLKLPSVPHTYVSYGYGLGWMSSNYKGFHHVHHSGGYLTHSTQLWLFPEVNAGIYLTVNGPQTRTRKDNLIKSVMHFISDTLLGETHWFNASAACEGIPQFTEGNTDDSKEASSNSSLQVPSNNEEHIETSPMPSHDSVFVCSNCPSIKSFVGTYSHKCFGKIYIFLTSKNSAEKHLAYRFGRFGEATFKRVSELKFQGNLTGPMQIFNRPGRISETLLFSLNEAGHIDGLQYLLEDKDKWTFFRRMSEESVEPGVRTVKARDAGSHLQIQVFPTVLGVCFALWSML